MSVSWVMLFVAVHASDLCLGLTDETLEHLGKIGPKAQKTSRRDLSVVLSQVNQLAINRISTI